MRRTTELCDGHHDVIRRRCFPRARALLVFSLGVSMPGLLACGGNDAGPSTDAGMGMSGIGPPMFDASFDGSLEGMGMGTALSCLPGLLCESPACMNVETTDLARGCRFYAAQLDNVDSDDGKNMMLILTNAVTNAPVNFVVEVRSLDGWELAAPAGLIGPNGTQRVELNRPAINPGITVYAAYRITSDGPIMVEQIISDDSDRMSTSSSGTILLPAHAQQNDYMAMTFQQLPSSAVTAAAGSRAGAAMIAVVGMMDQTPVTLTLTDTAVVSTGGATFVPTMPASDYTVTLNEGEVLQVFSLNPTGDLSGTLIHAFYPVEVFSGNIFTTYGNEVTGFNGGDMAMEQLPPLAEWSVEWVGARMAPQDGCDTFFGSESGGASWQVLASQDDTVVTLTPSQGTTILVDGKVFSATVATFRMKKGESRRFTTSPDSDLPAGALTPTGDFQANANANHPILLGQWLDCEPGLSLGVNTNFGANTDLTFGFPPGFQQKAVVVRMAGTPVQFDGETIPSYFFQRVAPGSIYEVARLTEDQFGTCQDPLDQGCSHRLSGNAYGLSWQGSDVVCSYSLTVPTADPCIVPNPACE